jgi:muramoyltetrapeptide carboxypeptidase LdcA involved in peptidoglycan recycling
LIKPKHLSPGDRVAIISPSWGGPSALPTHYALGRRTLEDLLGLEVVEMPNALAHPDWLAQHPEERAEDLHAAFADPSVQAVIASIGGEDSILMMPYLDLRVIAKNPKVFLGFSDLTTIHFACMKAGFASFYGPNVLPSLAARDVPFDYALTALKRTLFDTGPAGRLDPNSAGWTGQLFEYVAQGAENAHGLLHPSTGPRMLQGHGTVRGPLIGGCAEVLEMLKGTSWWPPLDSWRGAIMFYEAYAAPSPAYVTAWLRNFAAQGILQVLSGIIVGRPGEIKPEQHAEHDAAIRHVLKENGLAELPVMTNMDFGHTDPVFTLPYGVIAEIDCDAATFSLTESGVTGD